MSYNVKEVAKEFMLSPEELFEIFDVFFIEANEILEKCAKAIVEKDYELLKKLFHAFKGSAANLRMTKVYDLLIQLESGAKLSNEELIIRKLSELQEETLMAKNQIAGFYNEK